MEESMYMNPYTGSVGTYDCWWFKDEDGNDFNGVDAGLVIEVVWEDGAWKEKEE